MNPGKLTPSLAAACAALLLFGGCSGDTDPVEWDVQFSVAPPRGAIDTEFVCDARGLGTNEEGSIVEVRWDFDDDGSWDTQYSTQKLARHRFASQGEHRIRLEARLVGAGVAAATRTVLVTAPAWWDGFAPPPEGQGMNAAVFALTEWNGGVIAVGTFQEAGDTPANRVAFWNGAAWSVLGAGLNGAGLNAVAYEGDLIVGGAFDRAGSESALRVARWDGAAWHAMGSGFDDTPYAFAVWRGGLYAAGLFTRSGSTVLDHVARWDGASWQAIGSPFTDHVYALTVWDDQLIAAGQLNPASFPSEQKYLARFDGTSWKYMPGLHGTTYAAASHDGHLVTGGFGTLAGDVIANYIAFWDGNAWHAYGTGMDDAVLALATWNGDLLAAGRFKHAGGEAASGIARWNGRSWLPLGSGLAGLPDVQPWWILPAGQSVLVGGEFLTAGGRPSSYMARWDE